MMIGYSRITGRSLLWPILLICLPSMLAGGLGSDEVADPYRLRAQLSEEAAERMRSTGRLPNVISVGPFQTGVPALDRLNQEYAAVSIRQVFHPRPGFEERHRQHGLDRWVEITFRKPHLVGELATLYREEPDVLWAEPVYRKQNVSDDGFPNDERFAQQWALNNTGQGGGTPGADISATEAWELETGSDSVIVLVIDSGIDLQHDDFGGSLWQNPNSGLANGYLGDLHGWNFAEDSAQIQDTSGHGTQVSGILAAQTHNQVGIAGVAGGSGQNDGVRLMIARTFSGSNVGGFAEALVYGADNGAVIASNSWGYVDPEVFEQVVLDAIDYFITYAGLDEEGEPIGPMAGGLVVFAAGNSNSDERFFPAAYEPAMAVTGTNRNDQKSALSTYGTWIDLAAPGESILSTHIGNGYRTVSGTSFASPHVSGAAALLVSRFPGLTPDIVRERLVQTADSIDSLNPGLEGLLGGGRLNAFRSLNDDPEVGPSPVTDLTVSEVEQTRALLSWTAPGGSGEEGQAFRYDIRYSLEPIDESNFDQATPLDVLFSPSVFGEEEFLWVDGLQGETDYWFALRTRDVGGNVSDLSNIFSVQTLPPPEVMLEPDALDLNMPTGTTESFSFTISNIGQGPLRVELLEDSVPTWMDFSSAEWLLSEGQEETVSIAIHAEGLSDGVYSATLLLSTNDPQREEVVLPVTLTITGGEPNLELSVEQIDFGTVFIGFPGTYELVFSNTGTADLVVEGITVSGEEITFDSGGFIIPPGQTHVLELIWDPAEEVTLQETLTVIGTDVPTGDLTLPIVGLSYPPPQASLSVDSFAVTLFTGETDSSILEITNDGFHPLEYQAVWYALLPEEDEFTYEPLQIVQHSEEDSLEPVDLILDDGTIQNSIGLSNGGEFVWLNQFSPHESLFPFVLKEVEIYFPFAQGMSAGERIDLFIYQTDQSEPDENAELLQALRDVPVSALGQWTTFPLEVPIYLSEAKSILIAVVNRELGLNGFPAAIDQSGEPAGRSWIGTYSGGVPDVPNFPSNGLWGKIDNLGFPGNWMIRGGGHRDFFRLGTTDATVNPGDTGQIELLFDTSDLLEGTYGFMVELTTNDPTQETVFIPVTLEVAGFALANLSTSSLDFGEVFLGVMEEKLLTLQNQGTGELTILDFETSGDGFSTTLDPPLSLAPGESVGIAVQFQPVEAEFHEGELILSTNQEEDSVETISLHGLGLEPPQVDVDATPMQITVTPYVGTTRTLTIANTGSGAMNFQILRNFLSFNDDSILSLLEDEIRDRGEFRPVELILDDGTAEDGVGLTSGQQFIWGNHFTPEEGDFPFLLDQVEVYFSSADGINVSVGDRVDIHVYSLPNGTPEFGGTLEKSLLQREVQVLDDWTIYSLSEPLSVEEDLFLAVVFREPDFIGYPAAIDVSSNSQERSWVGIYYDDPPEAPFLPASDFWGLIDQVGIPGNWLIRGSGQHGLLSYMTGEGELSAGESAEVTLYFLGEGYPPGDYSFDLLVQTNDPFQPEMVIPVTVTVEEGDAVLAFHSPGIDFGPSLIGVDHERSITLENTGTGLLQVDSIVADEPAFSVDDSAWQLVPGEVVTIPLWFSPQEEIDYHGSLLFESNTGEGSPQGLDLAGLGTATESLARWMERGQLVGPPGDAASDPLGEGVAPLLRYALGLSPQDSALADLPRMTTHSLGETLHPALLFPTSQTAEDLTYRLEVSSDLIDWEAIPLSDIQTQVVEEDGLQSHALWIDTGRTVSGEHPLFYRLSVEWKDQQ